MSQILNIFRGDTPKGSVNLYSKDPVTGISVAYSIPTGALIEFFFPGDPTTVILSTANVGEVTIINAVNGNVGFAMSAIKSAVLKLGANQALDCRVTTLTGDILTAERVKVLKIVDRANV